MTADTAHVLHTPIDVLERRPWSDFLGYHAEAARIVKSRQL